MLIDTDTLIDNHRYSMDEHGYHITYTKYQIPQYVADPAHIAQARDYINAYSYVPITIDDMKDKIRALIGIPLLAFIGITVSDKINNLGYNDSGIFGKLIEFLILGNEPNNSPERDHTLAELKTGAVNNNGKLCRDIELMMHKHNTVSWEYSRTKHKLDSGIILITYCDETPLHLRCVIGARRINCGHNTPLHNKMHADYAHHLHRNNKYLAGGEKHGDRTIYIPKHIADEPMFTDVIV